MSGQFIELYKLNVSNYVFKLEYPCESTSDPFRRNCFSEALPLTNGNCENLIEESPRRS